MKFFTTKFGSYWDRMKESWMVYQWVYQELIPKASKKEMYKMIIPMFFYGLSGIMIPYCLMGVIDGLVNLTSYNGPKEISFLTLAGLIKPALYWIAAVVVLLVIRLWLHHSYMIYRENIKTRNQGGIEKKINEKLLEKSLGQHILHKNELNQSSLNRARSRIQNLEGLMMFQGVTAIFDLVISFILIWFISPFAGLVTGIAFGYYIYRSIVMNKEVVEKYKPIDDDYKAHNDKVEELWDKASRVKSLATEDDVKEYLVASYTEVSNRGKSFWINFIKQIRSKDTVNVIALAIIYVFITFSIAKDVVLGLTAIGVLIPIYSWTWTVIQNVWRIGHIEMEFSWCMPSIKKLRDALEIKPDIVDNNPSVTKIRETPHISFENIGFSYIDEKSNEKAVLRAVTFDILPGEIVALIGPSGAGKTTLAKITQRAFDPGSGKILSDGVNIKDVKVSEWMRIIGEIPQEVEIFNETLRENFLRAIPRNKHAIYSDEYIIQVAENHAVDFIKNLPAGLDTKLGHKGFKLSGGQRQRVAIVQMVLANKNLLIIDEATSSLDASATKKVQKGLMSLKHGSNKSCIVIAHNLSILKGWCDKFVVLRPLDGLTEGEAQIEAIGTSLDDMYFESPTLAKLMEDQEMVPVIA